MVKLRKRQIAKQYGVRYRRFANRNGDFHLFSSKRYSFGFYFCNDETFLNMVKNKKRWTDIDFKHRK